LFTVAANVEAAGQSVEEKAIRFVWMC